MPPNLVVGRWSSDACQSACFSWPISTIQPTTILAVALVVDRQSAIARFDWNYL
jgi:hypothetical protein